MKKVWVTLHCKDQAILDTVLCAVYVEDEETNDFDWKTFTVNETVTELWALKTHILLLEKDLKDMTELYENTHRKLVRVNEKFISHFL